MGIATTALRVTMGSVMAGHGLQKLAGKFGGPGLEATATGFEHMGFHPGLPYARAAAVTETVGGSLVALGALTPVGAAMVTGTMGVAIIKVHGPNGLWVTKGGYEYNLLLIAASFALTEIGPGRIALDGVIFKKRHGLFWAVFELAAGLGGAAAVAQLANRGAKAHAAANPAVADPAPVADDHASAVPTDSASSADVATNGSLESPAEAK